MSFVWFMNLEKTHGERNVANLDVIRAPLPKQLDLRKLGRGNRGEEAVPASDSNVSHDFHSLLCFTLKQDSTEAAKRCKYDKPSFKTSLLSSSRSVDSNEAKKNETHQTDHFLQETFIFHSFSWKMNDRYHRSIALAPRLSGRSSRQPP